MKIRWALAATVVFTISITLVTLYKFRHLSVAHAQSSAAVTQLGNLTQFGTALVYRCDNYRYRRPIC